MSVDPVAQAPQPPRRGWAFYVIGLPAGAVFLAGQAALRGIRDTVVESTTYLKAGGKESLKGLKTGTVTLWKSAKPPLELTGKSLWEGGTSTWAAGRQGIKATNLTFRTAGYATDRPVEWTGSALKEGGNMFVNGAEQAGQMLESAARPAHFALVTGGDGAVDAAREVGNMGKNSAKQTGKLLVTAYEVATMSGLLAIVLEELAKNAISSANQANQLADTVRTVAENTAVPAAEATWSLGSEATQVALVATLQEGVKVARATGQVGYVVTDASLDTSERTAREWLHLLGSMAKEGWKGTKESATLARLLLTVPAERLGEQLVELARLVHSGGREFIKMDRKVLRETAGMGQDVIGDPVIIWYHETKHEFGRWIQTLRGGGD